MIKCCAHCKFLKGNSVDPYEHCRLNKLKYLEILENTSDEETRRKLLEKIDNAANLIEPDSDWEQCANKDSSYYKHFMGNADMGYCRKYRYNKKQDKRNQKFIDNELKRAKIPWFVNEYGQLIVHNKNI